MGEEKKSGKKRFFLWAAALGAIGAVAALFRRRRSQSVDESEWQELPPADGS